MKNGQCSQKPVPNCTKVGQSGALDSSPNHYYVCLSRHGNLYPQIFICPHGWYFWGNYCRPEPEFKPNSSLKCTDDKKSDEGATSKEYTHSKERHDDIVNNNLIKTTSKPVYKINEYFSTDKAIIYPADTFLADKFDLTNYEVIEDAPPINDEFANSFESGDFW